MPIDAHKEFTGSLLHPAEPLRAARRADHAAAVPHPRRDVRRAQDRRPDPAPGAGAGGPGRAGRRRGRGGLPGLDPGRHRHTSARRCCSCWPRSPSSAGCSRRPGGREGWAFVGTFVTIALAVAGLFVALFPDVMPSSTDAGVLAHHHQRGRDAVHPDGDDLGGGDLHPGGAGLPELDLLGVPPPDLGAPHPGAAVRRAGPTLAAPARCDEAAGPAAAPYLRRASAALTGVVAAGVLGSVLLLAQLFAVAHLVVVLVDGGHRSERARRRLLVLAATLRPGGWRRTPGTRARPGPPRRSTRDLRHRLVRAALRRRRRRGPPGRASWPCWPTRGPSRVEPYLTRYLPALVLAVVLPLAHAARDRHPGPARAGHRAGDAAAGAGVRGARRRWPPATAPRAVAGARLAVGPLPRRRARAAHAGGLPRGPAAGATHPQRHRPLPPGHPATRCGWRSPPRRCWSWWPRCRSRWWPSRSGCGWRRGRWTWVRRWWCCCWRPRRTGRCAGSGRSSTPRPRGRRPSRRWTPCSRPSRDRGSARCRSDRSPSTTSPSPTRAAARRPSRCHGSRCGRTRSPRSRGPSGSGKSTLLDLLAGLRRAGAPGRSPCTGAAASRGAGPLAGGGRLAPQRPWLVAGTIADNVRLGRPDATDDEVRGAWTGSACCRPSARSGTGPRPSSARTARGLSAGQRARLALARAVLAQRPLVLVDEPSAHLDAATEQVVADTLRWLARRSTVVVVTHPPALLEHADTVVTLAAPAPAVPSRRPGPPSARAPAPAEPPCPTTRPPRTRARHEPAARGARVGLGRRADRHGRLADHPGRPSTRRCCP